MDTSRILAALKYQMLFAKGVHNAITLLASPLISFKDGTAFYFTTKPIPELEQQIQNLEIEVAAFTQREHASANGIHQMGFLAGLKSLLAHLQTPTPEDINPTLAIDQRLFFETHHTKGVMNGFAFALNICYGDVNCIQANINPGEDGELNPHLPASGGRIERRGFVAALKQSLDIMNRLQAGETLPIADNSQIKHLNFFEVLSNVNNLSGHEVTVGGVLVLNREKFGEPELWYLASDKTNYDDLSKAILLTDNSKLVLEYGLGSLSAMSYDPLDPLSRFRFLDDTQVTGTLKISGVGVFPARIEIYRVKLIREAHGYISHTQKPGIDVDDIGLMNMKPVPVADVSAHIENFTGKLVRLSGILVQVQRGKIYYIADSAYKSFAKFPDQETVRLNCVLVADASVTQKLARLGLEAIGTKLDYLCDIHLVGKLEKSDQGIAMVEVVAGAVKYGRNILEIIL